MKTFKDKVLMITGGTGSFGNAVLSKFLESPLKEIRILSRDEKKQDDMRKIYNSKKLKFYIADVRDYDSVQRAMMGVDYVFHAAALKQVPSCEFHPLEAVKTNVIGTDNVIRASIDHQIQKVICLSTDKAVYPINSMGISKAMMEKVAIASSRESTDTNICVTRYGNVMASRGSVIPLFVSQILNNNPITITDPSMTRFMMSLEDAVDLVLFAFEKGNSGDILVQKSPAATIQVLVDALQEIFKKYNPTTEIIGTRHGEKLFETLLSREEYYSSSDLDNYFLVPPDLRDLNYEKFYDQGQPDISQYDDYNSHNTKRLSKEEMIEMLLGLDFINKAIEGNLQEEVF
tara:strand:- start:799 stop:1833 length:1035 start_codon:yes stop_codon:yes gene_type:complete